MSKESHVGIAQSQRAPSHDSLALTLEETRRNVHASTLPRRRALWRYCTIAYRDWLGIQLVEDAPIIKVEPLTKLELVELLQLADEVPTVVRDLLRLRKEARISQRKITLRKQEWAAPRVAMLVELHQLALFAAGAEYAKARKAYEKAQGHAPRQLRSQLSPPGQDDHRVRTANCYSSGPATRFNCAVVMRHSPALAMRGSQGAIRSAGE